MAGSTADVNELKRQIDDLRAGFKEATAAIVALGQTNEKLQRDNEILRQRLLDEILYKAQLIDVLEAK